MTRFRTLFIGQTFHSFTELGSTNEAALYQLSKNTPPEGTVISADYQTQGRGQIGRTWESEACANVTLSVILYPKFLAPTQQFSLSQVSALAVRSVVVELLAMPEKVSVKWPNDIFIEDHKVAGILIQNTLSKGQISASVIGIGINVNQRKFSSTRAPATSLSLVGEATYGLDTVRQLLFQNLEFYYLQLRREGPDALQAAYHRHLYRRGKSTRFERASGEQFVGTLQGVTPQGKLSITTGRGQETFDLRSVRLLPDED